MGQKKEGQPRLRLKSLKKAFSFDSAPDSLRSLQKTTSWTSGLTSLSASRHSICYSSEGVEMTLPRRGVASLCKQCGQFHSPVDSHLYDYRHPLDDDLTCGICLQPLVDPVDTRCGHTFCSRCIRNYLKLQSICPIDRNRLSQADLSPAPVIIRRLLDKQVVVCPNVDYCEEVLPRSDLEAHLLYRCPGAVIKCMREEHGCQFQGPRSAMESHLWECKYRDKQDKSFDASIEEGEVCRISIARDSFEIGMSIVGGCDTPLVCVTVQEVFPDGLIDMDNRLRAGDQILEANGVDLTQATHHQAKRAINQLLPTLKLTVFRDRGMESKQIEKEEVFKLTLYKEEDNPLGIKLVGKRNQAGVYILELLPGTVASMDGRLRVNDRILEVNRADVSGMSQGQAAKCIQAANGKVRLVVSRKSQGRRGSDEGVWMKPVSEEEGEEGSEGYDSDRSGSLACFARQNSKTVVIEKQQGESLGLSVSGGVGSTRGNTPLYVMNMQLNGTAYRSRAIKKGDILIAIDGTSLIGLTHDEAVHALKAKGQGRRVTLTIVEGSESCGGIDNFLPSWLFWLRLTNTCPLEKEVMLSRPHPSSSLGLAIVGGSDSKRGKQHIYLKSTVRGSPASRASGLRCGDIILSVNGVSLAKRTHNEAVSVLKNCGTFVTLKVVSWPGTAV